MPVAWYICPYKSAPGEPEARYCAMNDFTAQIWTDNGFSQGNVPGSPQFWSETEVLGNHAVVKVRASAATIAALNAEPGFTRLPKDELDLSLSDLTNPQKIALRDQIESLGYPRAEWQAALGTDLGAKTLRDVLRFITRRRLKARFDIPTQTVVLDGAIQPCRDVEDVNVTVT